MCVTARTVFKHGKPHVGDRPLCVANPASTSTHDAAQDFRERKCTAKSDKKAPDGSTTALGFEVCEITDLFPHVAACPTTSKLRTSQPPGAIALDRATRFPFITARVPLGPLGDHPGSGS